MYGAADYQQKERSKSEQLLIIFLRFRRLWVKTEAGSGKTSSLFVFVLKHPGLWASDGLRTVMIYGIINTVWDDFGRG